MDVQHQKKLLRTFNDLIIPPDGSVLHLKILSQWELTGPILLRSEFHVSILHLIIHLKYVNISCRLLKLHEHGTELYIFSPFCW